jgi:hypothetical protein
LLKIFPTFIELKNSSSLLKSLPQDAGPSQFDRTNTFGTYFFFQYHLPIYVKSIQVAREPTTLVPCGLGTH